MFGIGIITYFSTSYSNEFLLNYKSITCLLMLFFVFSLIYLKYGLIILFSFFWSALYTNMINTKSLDSAEQNVILYGNIESIDHFKNRFRLIIPYNRCDKDNKNNEKIRLRVSHKLDLKEGDYIKCIADILPLSEPPTPYSFDTRFDAYFRKIVGTGRIKYIKKHIPINNLSIKQKISKNILENMNFEEAAIAHAIVLGDKTYIDNDIKNVYSASGISHLLAISGLHLMLLAGIVFLFIRGLLAILSILLDFINKFNTKKIAAIFTLLITFFYMLIAGLGYPIQRAFIMLCVLMTSVIVDRIAIPIRGICFSAIIILFLRPESIMSLSFQLSYAAVLALTAFFEKCKLETPFKWIVGSFSSTMVASIATTPFIAISFHQITLTAPITNMICVPIFTFFVMPFGILSILIGGYFYKLWEKSIYIINIIADKISKISFSNIFVPLPSSNFPFAFMVIGGLILCLSDKSKINELTKDISLYQKYRIFMINLLNSNKFGILIVCLGLALYRPIEPPNKFFSPDGKITAYRKGHILYTDNPRKGKYYLEEWAKTYGLTIKKS